MSDLFDFITGDEFRASLAADYAELDACLAAHAYKAVAVLSGSIIEAVLLDFLYTKSSEKATVLKMDLGVAITECRKADVLSQRTADLCSVIKEYRNLIHPGRVVRLKESVDADTASIAKSLVGLIVKEVAEMRRASYGFTAEQIASKMENDPSALSILRHLLASTNESETRRLLLKVLPSRFLELSFANEYDGERVVERGFRHALELASDDIKRSVASRFVAVLKEETGEIVNAYSNFLFRVSDLQYLSISEASIAREHLFGRLDQDHSGTLLRVVQGIGPFLSAGDAGKLVDYLVGLLSYRDKATRGLARGLLTEEYRSIRDAPIQTAYITRLNDWIEHCKETPQRDALGKEIVEIKESLTPEW